MVEDSVAAVGADGAARAVDPAQVVSIARALIAAPTENPGGDEWPAVAVVRRALDDVAIESRLVESDAGRPSVVASIGTGPPTLVWNGHLDVVPAGDVSAWRYPPFDARLEGGTLWGRGAADMKGPIASAIAAIAAIVRSNTLPGGTLELHLVADEEHQGIHGTRVLLERGMLQADACVVGEPSRMRLGLAQRGGAFFSAVARGRAAHGSTPHLGVNAIDSMARFILRLPEVLPDREHPLVGRPTVTATMIHGGRAPNVVPDRCEATIDRRTLPGESLAEVRAPVERLLERLRREHEEFDVRVEFPALTEAAEVSPDVPIARAVRAAVVAELGKEPEDMGFTGITDARFYVNDANIPAIVFGPGDLRVAHGADEHVPVDDLVAAARIYARTFVGFLGS
jgi:succinyl-diaminopimelate desuccinylase